MNNEFELTLINEKECKSMINILQKRKKNRIIILSIPVEEEGLLAGGERVRLRLLSLSP